MSEKEPGSNLRMLSFDELVEHEKKLRLQITEMEAEHDKGEDLEGHNQIDDLHSEYEQVEELLKKYKKVA